MTPLEFGELFSRPIRFGGLLATSIRLAHVVEETEHLEKVVWPTITQRAARGGFRFPFDSRKTPPGRGSFGGFYEQGFLSENLQRDFEVLNDEQARYGAINEPEYREYAAAIAENRYGISLVHDGEEFAEDAAELIADYIVDSLL